MSHPYRRSMAGRQVCFLYREIQRLEDWYRIDRNSASHHRRQELKPVGFVLNNEARGFQVDLLQDQAQILGQHMWKKWARNNNFDPFTDTVLHEDMRRILGETNAQKIDTVCLGDHVVWWETIEWLCFREMMEKKENFIFKTTLAAWLRHAATLTETATENTLSEATVAFFAAKTDGRHWGRIFYDMASARQPCELLWRPFALTIQNGNGESGKDVIF